MHDRHQTVRCGAHVDPRLLTAAARPSGTVWSRPARPVSSPEYQQSWESSRTSLWERELYPAPEMEGCVCVPGWGGDRLDECVLCVCVCVQLVHACVDKHQFMCVCLHVTVDMCVYVGVCERETVLACHEK